EPEQGDGSRAGEGRDGLRGGARQHLLRRTEADDEQAGSRVEEARRGHRRRLLRIEAHRRSRRDVHARRAGTAQPVRPGFLPRDAGRQSAQARGSREEGRDERPRPEDLRGRVSGNAVAAPALQKGRSYTRTAIIVIASSAATSRSAFDEMSQLMFRMVIVPPFTRLDGAPLYSV